jgi:ubiquinone/menaquinone biosynthesis C-methylase UbiE
LRLCLTCATSYDADTWTCPACQWSPAWTEFALFAPELAETDEHYPREVVDRLAELEDHYFWYAARASLISWLIGKYFPRATSLLEVGCGSGYVLSTLRAAYPELRLAGVDLLPRTLRLAQERVPQAMLLQCDARRLPFTDEFDVVCALDVIEHIDEPEIALAEMARAVTPGGGVIVSVPQHPWLWSAWDEFDRHRLRYTRRGLLELLVNVGVEPVRVTSSVMFLLPLLLASRLRNRRLMPEYDPYRELRIPDVANRILGEVMRAERWLTRVGVSLPVGSSLVVAGRRS